MIAFTSFQFRNGGFFPGWTTFGQFVYLSFFRRNYRLMKQTTYILLLCKHLIDLFQDLFRKWTEHSICPYGVERKNIFPKTKYNLANLYDYIHMLLRIIMSNFRTWPTLIFAMPFLKSSEVFRPFLNRSVASSIVCSSML